MLCFFINGIVYAVGFAFDLIKIYTTILSSFAYCITVIIIIYKSDKQELRRIFAWKKISLAEFSGIIIMFSGAIILYSKLCQIVPLFIPVPDDFWKWWYSSSNSLLLLIISSCVFPGFTEELFYRGLILRRFCRVYSPLKALILSSIIFGLMHVNPWQMITTPFMGFLLGWIYLRYKSIWLCVFLHFMNNLLAIFWISPTVEKYNSAFYTFTELQPLWLDMIGLMLFGIGLFITLMLTKEQQGIFLRKKAIINGCKDNNNDV